MASPLRTTPPLTSTTPLTPFAWIWFLLLGEAGLAGDLESVGLESLFQRLLPPQTSLPDE